MFRHGLVQVFLAGFFSIAPATVPVWRADPVQRPVAELAVGTPMLRHEPRR